MVACICCAGKASTRTGIAGPGQVLAIQACLSSEEFLYLLDELSGFKWFLGKAVDRQIVTLRLESQWSSAMYRCEHQDRYLAVLCIL